MEVARTLVDSYDFPIVFAVLDEGGRLLRVLNANGELMSVTMTPGPEESS